MDEEFVSEPNKKLGKICKDNFFFGDKTCKGNVGLYVLGELVDCPTKDFENYLSMLESIKDKDEQREM